MKRVPSPEIVHPVPNISKFTVGGNVGGMMIAVSIIVLAMIGLPVARWFLAGGLALGGIFALFLRWRDRA
jgi:hypothetical protein